MAQIPVWLTAPGGPLTLVVTPQSVASDGTLSDTTPVATMTASVDKIGYSYKAVTEEISAMTASRSHNVKLQSSSSMTIGEILKKSGSNLLAAAAATNDIFKVVLTRGAQAFTYYGLLTGYDEDINRGKSTGSAAFEMIDIGASNPAYA